MLAQAKKIRATVPKLAEAKNPKGYIKTGSAKTLKILCIGESTIAGVGVDFHEFGFAGTLAKTLSEKEKISVLGTGLVSSRSGCHRRKKL